MSVENIVKDLEKRFGSGAVMLWGDKPKTDVEVISTTCLSFDNALGIGGIPKGRIVEIFGMESSGKSTVALTLAAQVQREGGKVAYIDSEFALDAEYAQNLGVQMNDIILSQPDSAEQALEITEHIVRSGQIALVVVDSVAALVPQSELNGEMGDAQMGVMARMMSQAMRKIVGAVAQTNTCLVFINQLRSKIGVVFGSPFVTSGGNALKFYSSIRMEISKKEALKNGDNVVGNRTKVKIVKNKLAPPFKTCEFDIIYGEGISREADLIDLAVENKIFTKSGAWYSYNDENFAQGKEKARLYLKENRDFADEIQLKIQEKLI